ncbi:MAG: aminotransferase class V-fold PLP-dependent enzyme [Armatimonadetes bacterium]|nr:aminotransferase class V-fold PLP-dependent enzyme [Armatimonadota bacterium]
MNLPNCPLTKDLVDREIRPLFSRVLKAHEGVEYLANHSLGRPLDQTFDNIARGAALWADKLDEAWSDEHWMGEAHKYRSLIAKLLDLDDPSAVVPKTSAGQGLRAVLNSFPSDRKVNVVTTRGEFDSIDFILKTYAQQGRATVRWIEPGATEGAVPTFQAGDIIRAIDDSTDLVVVSAVFFGTGQVLQDFDQVVTKAHACGALVLLDVYHAIGVFPFSMTAFDADFCIGGCYKYLRGGPGACYLAIHPRILAEGRRTLDTGWFAKKDTFQYLRPETADTWPGGDGWLESTPPVLTAYQATPGLEFTLDVGVERIRDYTLELLDSIRESLRRRNLDVFQPQNPNQWGAYALVHSDDAPKLCDNLRTQGIVTDARGDFVRFGPDLLTKSM